MASQIPLSAIRRLLVGKSCGGRLIMNLMNGQRPMLTYKAHLFIHPLLTHIRYLISLMLRIKAQKRITGFAPVRIPRILLKDIDELGISYYVATLIRRRRLPLVIRVNCLWEVRRHHCWVLMAYFPYIFLHKRGISFFHLMYCLLLVGHLSF